uniref:MADS-box transcription factor n=2 Tax=Houttuynia cordata TaxID=16752 RepID=Q7XAQ3_HOUCO|nr:MADS-box transcription factor [Houttuynia cordata]
MGRGKIQIKRIENVNNRQVTYSKRKRGIIKKAQEISVLCDAHVSLVIFSTSGNMGVFCSPQTKVDQILSRYQQNTGNQLWDAKHEYLKQEVERIKKENDRLRIKLRHLKGEDITSLHHQELTEIEYTLEDGLANIRKKQMDCWNIHEKRIRAMEEDNQSLAWSLHQKGVEDDTKGIVREYLPRDSSLTFRVQPLQPNLQQMK